VTKENDVLLRCFACDESLQVLDVVFEVNGGEVARSLVATPVVDDDVESLEALREPGERPPSVKGAVHTDDAGLGLIYSTLGDGQSLHRGGGDEVRAR
jgi:hypothetical protein